MAVIIFRKETGSNIDLRKPKKGLDALEYIAMLPEGKRFFWNKETAQDSIKESASVAVCLMSIYRWLGGLLTNLQDCTQH